MALPVNGGGDGLDGLDGRAYFVFSIAEVALTGCMLLLMLSVCGYVVRCRRRGRRLCLPRSSLGMLGILWVLCTFFSHVALWDVLDALGVVSVAPLADELEIVCVTTTTISLGLVEPALLLLIAEVIRLKTAVSTARRRSIFPRWTLNRRAYALALPFVLLQALLMGVGSIDGLSSQGFLPQPGLSPAVGAQPSPPPPPLPPPTPLTSQPNDDIGVGPTAPRAVMAHEYRWWHTEGCAHSIASLIVSAVFILPFEFFWTLWCLRLSKLVLNLKMRRRLLVVQLTYTLIPGAILLLRASKIFIPADLEGVRGSRSHTCTASLPHPHLYCPRLPHPHPNPHPHQHPHPHPQPRSDMHGPTPNARTFRDAFRQIWRGCMAPQPCPHLYRPTIPYSQPHSLSPL
jgi:hypothetical protein